MNYNESNRDKAIGKSMPRKSKHGSSIARWGHHDEMKEKKMRRKNVNKRGIPIP